MPNGFATIHTQKSVENVTRTIFGENRTYMDYEVIDRLMGRNAGFDDMSVVLKHRTMNDIEHVSFRTIDDFSGFVTMPEFGGASYIQCEVQSKTSTKVIVGDYHSDASVAFLSAIYNYKKGM